MSTEAAPQVVHVHHHHAPAKSTTTAILLELLPGFFTQIFGIGNIYAGNVGIGLLLMFSYWFLLVVNILLCFVVIGLITLPLTWIAYMIIAPILANNAAIQANEVA